MFLHIAKLFLMKTKKLLLESLLATVLVFVTMFVLFQLVHISFKPFNYVAKTIKEINLNDLYFSSLNNNTVDTSIVIVNIENLDRDGIADVLARVAAAQPAVIGLDVFFSSQRATPYDSLLQATLMQLSEKIVIARKYTPSGTPDLDYWQHEGLSTGHAGILTNKNNTSIVRSFEPFIMSDSEKAWAFSAEIARKYKPEAFEALSQRNKPSEILNYKGAINAFRLLNYRDVAELTPENSNLLRGKIVLLGFCGGNTMNTSDYSDMFYTPVGFDMSPNRRPDMYGVVLHANIVSMLLSQNYISKVPMGLIVIIVVLLTFLHVLLYSFFYVKQHLYYHVVAKLAQLVSFSLVLWVIFLLFSHFQLYFPAKYVLLPVILSVDVLYLYEALAVFLYKKFHIKSLFVHEH